jgi:hypothetical protein
LEVRSLLFTFTPSSPLLPYTPVGYTVPCNSTRSSNTDLDSEGLSSWGSLNLPMHLVSIDFSSSKAFMLALVLSRTFETFVSISFCLLLIAQNLVVA